MMAESIKDFVLRAAREGEASSEKIWRAAEERFPFKCVGRLYVLSILRDQRKLESKQ